MIPQPHRFHDGSGVVHRLAFASRPRMRYSVWVDREGNYVDAEGIDRRGHSRPVRSAEFQRILAKRAAIWLRQADGPPIVAVE